jgi:hypothetical protein
MSSPFKLASFRAFALKSGIEAALHARPTSRLSAFSQIACNRHGGLHLQFMPRLLCVQSAPAPDSLQALAQGLKALHP